MNKNVEAFVLSEVRKCGATNESNDEKLVALPLRDLDLDSLSVLEIVMNIEDYYRIEIDESKFNECLTVKDVVSLVKDTIDGHAYG
jgi:acyl carrier protein